MQSTMNNRTSRQFPKERSLSSMPSRQFSVANIMQSRQSAILEQNQRQQMQKNNINGKEQEISKLRKNLETAVSTALHQRLESSKVKEDIVTHTHMQTYLQNKIQQFQKENQRIRLQLESTTINLKEVNSSLHLQREKSEELEVNLRLKIEELQKIEQLNAQINKYKILLKDIDPLKGRISLLEEQVRNQKIKKKEAQQKLFKVQAQKQELQILVSQTKPREQQLRQRIAYFERVNLDLSRKMQDFSRRQNDYLRNISNLKTNLTKVTADRNQFKTVAEQTSQKLQKKTIDFNQLTVKYEEEKLTIEKLKKELDDEKQITRDLRTSMEGQNLYYKKQGEENVELKRKNKVLQEIQFQLRRVIEGYVKISEEVNITIVQRTEQIKRLKIRLQSYEAQINQLQLKFQKFDHLLEQGSQKGYNQVREGFYAILRANTEFAIKMKELQAQFQQKFMLLGEERDMINRTQTLRSVDPPNDQNQMLSIFHQKTEAIVLLENSNDQLLKVKKVLEGKIDELYLQIQKEKKEMTLLKIKTAQMFRAKKDLDQARKKMQRYQEMIQEQNQVAADMQSQMGVLRQKNSELNQRHFLIELEKKNLQVKLQQVNDIIKELDADVLERNKQINQKNSHLIQDSLQKLQSAIKSLSFFFNCAFCGELPLTPVTLALCGHTYCLKCKQAYAESCYQCDTGLPIEKVFQNRFLKDAAGKYKFLTMVLKELNVNFIQK